MFRQLAESVVLSNIDLIIIFFALLLYNFIMLFIESKEKSAEINLSKQIINIIEKNYLELIFVLFLFCFFEEIIFRYLLLFYSDDKVILLSALAFALVHLLGSNLSVIDVISNQFLSAIIYSFLLFSTGSILYPVLFHFLRNLIFFSIMKYSWHMIPEEEKENIRRSAK